MFDNFLDIMLILPIIIYERNYFDNINNILDIFINREYQKYMYNLPQYHNLIILQSLIKILTLTSNYIDLNDCYNNTMFYKCKRILISFKKIIIVLLFTY